MVRTRQGMYTKPPSMWRGSKGKNVDNRQEEGPLDDTTSHMPITSS